MSKNKVCVVLPCYKVKNQIYTVYKKLIKKKIDCLIFVDDKCPEESVKYLKSITKKNTKIKYIFLKKNLGVGGATFKGLISARDQNYDIIVKFDSDNQHRIKDLMKIINSLKREEVLFCKGYRDLSLIKSLKRNMPFIRVLGANVLTFMSKITTKNFDLKDVTNGLFGIKSKILKNINLKNLKKNYFFEQDLIFRISNKKIKIFQIKSEVIYGNENSNLKPLAVIMPFLIYHIKNFFYKN